MLGRFACANNLIAMLRPVEPNSAPDSAYFAVVMMLYLSICAVDDTLTVIFQYLYKDTTICIVCSRV